jgi:hypothetical protein
MTEAPGWATRAAWDLVGRDKLEEAIELALQDEFGEDELRRLKESNARKRERDEENARLWREFAEQSRGEPAGGTTDLSAAEERAVDAVMADYTGRTVETPVGNQTTDLSEQEDRGGAAKERAGGYFGTEEFLRVTAEDTGELPESVRQDAILQDELRRQAHERAFGEPSQLTDDEMWAQYRESIGEDA